MTGPSTHPTASRPSVAVIGAGVSGLTAAYLLRHTHDVVLFEADDRLGGHAHTHDVTASDGSRHAVDSGFIVHNDRTYPHLRRLFGELDVQVHPTEMSMSIRCEECGLEYAGGRGLTGLLAQRSRVLDPRFLRMLLQVRRFHRRALAFLRTSPEDDLTTYGEFLAAEGFSDHFLTHYAVPVVSCVWSAGAETALQYPARYLFRFLDHHGMLQVTGSPQWYTVVGGSRTYVERIGAQLPAVRRSHPVTDVTRHADGVDVRDASGEVTRVDRVVIATHADQALALLTDPTDDEVTTLKSFGYSRNETVLHTDASILPEAGAARASWNYLMGSCGNRSDSTGRHLLDEPAAGPRLPRPAPRDPQRAGADRPGHRARGDAVRAPDLHPRGGRRPAAAARPGHRPDRVRRRLPRLGLPRGRLPLGCRGGARVRGDLVSAPGAPTTATLPPLPALVEGHVSHSRKAALRNAFRHRVYQWLVDLDALPGAAVVPAPVHRVPGRRPPRRPAPQHQGQPGRLRRPARRPPR